MARRVLLFTSMTRTKREKRTAAKAVAEHNTVTHTLLEAIKHALPSCGPEAHWGHAGDAAHVREQLEGVAKFLGIELQAPRVYTVVRGDGTRVTTTVPE